MPQMDELADRLQVSKEELMEAVADTGYELVPTAGPADPAGMAGMEEDMAEEDMAEEGGGPGSLEDVLAGIEGGEEGMADEEAMEGEEEMMDPAPAGMEGGGVKGVSISVMRGNAAKNALKKEKGRKS